MSKRHRRKALSSKPAVGRQPTIPSAPTLYRLTELMDQGRSLVDKATMMAGPLLKLRDGEAIDAIKQAKTVEALLDLAPEARGAAESAWHERVRRLGMGVAPLIAQRLRVAALITDQDDRDIAQERLIAALRWQGGVGGRLLQDCFDGLDAYSQGLACTAFGLLRDQTSADRIWKFYQRATILSPTTGDKIGQPESHFVGALWGLIDLQDARASEALIDLLATRRVFYELYGFLALAGDERTIAPLMKRLARLPAKRGAENEDAMMALIAIAQRIGRDGGL